MKETKTIEESSGEARLLQSSSIPDIRHVGDDSKPLQGKKLDEYQKVNSGSMRMTLKGGSGYIK